MGNITACYTATIQQYFKYLVYYVQQQWKQGLPNTFVVYRSVWIAASRRRTKQIGGVLSFGSSNQRVPEVDARLRVIVERGERPVLLENITHTPYVQQRSLPAKFVRVGRQSNTSHLSTPSINSSTPSVKRNTTVVIKTICTQTILNNMENVRWEKHCRVLSSPSKKK